MTIRHVFVFRHCVRSPEAKLIIDDPSSVTYSTNPTDYLAVPLPDWQTAPMGCTAAGLDIVQNTGQYLLESYLPLFGPTHKVNVEFVTDTDQRDVDTSLHLAQGMATVVQQQTNPSSMQLQGLQQLTYDAELFNPTALKWDTNRPPCTEAPRGPWNKYVAERLDTISPPHQNISQVIEMIEHYGGVGAAGSIANLTQTFVNQNVSLLGGQIRLVDYLAQTAFYAAASEIPFAMLSNMTQTELFDLVAWFHWERAVMSVGNNHAALLGGVLMDRILRTLNTSSSSSTSNSAAADSDPDQVAHFFIGHDGDLDHLATALGMTWVLPEPYRSGTNGMWTPTPPSAGLHFSYDDEQDNEESLTISILTPMYFNQEDDDESKTLIVNKTGILEERPVNFTQQLDDNNHNNVTIMTSVKHGRTVVKSSNPHTSHVLDSLRMRVEQILQTYEGAMECYQKTAAKAEAAATTPAPAPTTLSPSAAVDDSATSRPTMSAYNTPYVTAKTVAPTTTTTTDTKTKPKSVKGQALEVWMVFILMAAGLFVVLRKIQRRGRRHGVGKHGATYTEMGDARHHELSLEMT
eukprot:scaffold575_cov186-Amphora_coffeaeformis.AAC.14